MSVRLNSGLAIEVVLVLNDALICDTHLRHRCAMSSPVYSLANARHRRVAESKVARKGLHALVTLCNSVNFHIAANFVNTFL